MVLALGWPAPARAAWRLDWVPTVGTGGTYFDVRTTDPGSTPIEDVENRQQLDNSVAVDNAYLHLGVQYDVTRVALQTNQELNYLDHQVGMNLNVDRWLRRYTQDGRLTLTATARVSPSLPPLDPQRLPTGASGRDPQAVNDLSPTEYFVHHDVLNIRDDPSGYTVYYGASYSDNLDPFHRYEAGWNVEDNRYDSALVRDSRILHLQSTYAVRLRQGEVGARVSHERQLGGGRFKDLYGVSVFRSEEARRLTWRIEPGVTYRPSTGQARAAVGVSSIYTMRRATLETSYASTWGVSVIGVEAVQRIHEVFFNLHTNHNYRTPRWLSLDARWEEFSRRLEGSIGQRFQIVRSVAVVFQYSNSAVWWDNGTAPDMVSWRAQTIGGDLRWEF